MNVSQLPVLYFSWIGKDVITFQEAISFYKKKSREYIVFEDAKLYQNRRNRQLNLKF